MTFMSVMGVCKHLTSTVTGNSICLSLFSYQVHELGLVSYYVTSTVALTPTLFTSG